MKRLSLAGAALAVAVFAVACSNDTTAPTTAPGIVPLASKSANTGWKVSNILPGTSKLWDINQLDASAGAVGSFPINEFLTTTTGSFAVYLLDNYNVDITGQTFNATAAWTPGTYVTRGPAADGAYVRFVFKDVTSGLYTSSDYWWSTVNCDLNGAATCNLTAALTDRTLWTNLCGKSATDTNSYSGANCVGGTDPAVSPYDGFTNAMKNVKQVGLSFGRASRYASGVALVGAAGTFTLNTFAITQ